LGLALYPKPGSDTVFEPKQPRTIYTALGIRKEATMQEQT